MTSKLLTLYVLFWPLIASLVLFTICLNVYKDAQQAKETGEGLV
ncbi:putative transporter small subunit [Acinetobacter indicus]|nr:putative transporter small subunit [Acinetobacter indicus]